METTAVLEVLFNDRLELNDTTRPHNQSFYNFPVVSKVCSLSYPMDDLCPRYSVETPAAAAALLVFISKRRFSCVHRINGVILSIA